MKRKRYGIAAFLTAAVLCGSMTGCGNTEDSSAESSTGILVQGSSSVDESMLTGESVPVEKSSETIVADTSDIVGRWEMRGGYNSDGQLVDSLQGVPLAIVMQIEFQDGGAATEYFNGKQSTTSTWSMENNEITYHSDSSSDTSDAITFTYEPSKNLLFTTVNDVQMEFGKVDEFTTVDDSVLQGIVDSGSSAADAAETTPAE